jgi:hypothetical protein
VLFAQAALADITGGKIAIVIPGAHPDPAPPGGGGAPDVCLQSLVHPRFSANDTHLVGLHFS